MPIALLSAASFISWFISMIAGGGSPLLLVPTVNVLLGSQSVAPVLTIGLLAGNLQRCWLLRAHIDWRIAAWQLPGVFVGAGLGAIAFTQIRVEGLQLVIALLLLWMLLHSWLSQHVRLPCWQIRAWQFLPLSFLNAVGSGLVGTTGPILNPAYLSYGLTKEAMIATKSATLVLGHCVKLVVYGSFGVLSPDILGYGALIGLMALPANWLGNQVLQMMSAQQFKRTVFLLIGVSGLLTLWQERGLLGI
ncbi:MAG: sulfite exporter TauE/SafE family protein [Leptolyngbya sp. SIO4C1]|nr:sulfite exporter TauE/SafE family protein [Leptolyngbya sp. SIO4C1]